MCTPVKPPDSQAICDVGRKRGGGGGGTTYEVHCGCVKEKGDQGVEDQQPNARFGHGGRFEAGQLNTQGGKKGGQQGGEGKEGRRHGVVKLWMH